jgi:hypothetical protein
VLERLAGDGHRELAAVGEVHGRLATWDGGLLEEDLLVGAVLRAPLADAALQRAELTRSKLPGYLLESHSKIVRACRRPSVSALNRGSMSTAHTPSNGSSRVRQVRGPVFCDGNGPACHTRAVRSLIPAAAAAAANVLPAMRCSRKRCTCRSVTNPNLRVGSA